MLEPGEMFTINLKPYKILLVLAFGPDSNLGLYLSRGAQGLVCEQTQPAGFIVR